jgi:TonB family protein
MAPIEVKLPSCPDTLPEDFSDWDSESVAAQKQAAAAAAAAVQRQAAAAPKAVPVENLRPAEKRDVTPRQPIQRDITPRSIPPRDVAPRPTQRIEAKPAPIPETRVKVKYKEVEQEEEEKPSGGINRGVVFAIASLILCGGLGAAYMLRGSFMHSDLRIPAVAAGSAASAGVSTATDAKPDPGKTLGTDSPASTSTAAGGATAQQTPQTAQQTAQTAQQTAQQQQQPVSASSNTAQYNATSRIQHGQSIGSAPEPSGNLDMSGMGGMGTVSGNSVVLPSSGGSVKYSPNAPQEVSAGVLSQMLIQRTVPVYPAFAKQARIQGTVRVAAIITKQGTVSSPHAVDGPAPLRQAAVDAVKNWRYRPCILNGQPVEVKATINVNFTLQ